MPSIFTMDIDTRWAREMSTLTPGDFAVVNKKVQFLDAGKDIKILMDMLYQEVNAKNEIRKNPFGFRSTD